MTTLKFLVAALAAVLAGVLPGLTPLGDGIALVEVANIVALAAAAIAVYNSANLPSYPYAKLVPAAIGAVAVAFMGFYGDGALDASEIVQLVLAGLSALGVAVLPNSGTSGGVFLVGRHAVG